MKTIKLTDAQAARLRDLVNDKQDALFEKLTVVVKLEFSQVRENRANGLRNSLKFWDVIDRAIRDASGSMDGTPAEAGLVDDSDEVSIAYQEDTRDPHNLGGV